MTSRIVWALPVLALLGSLVYVANELRRTFRAGRATAMLSIPAQADWTDYGLIFEAGALGEWDHHLYGGFTTTAIKKNGLYYLYYQGASGYRVVDDSVTWRAIGVATSPDGINFTRYSGNPVITWFPNDNGEEGAVSGGVVLDDRGRMAFFYGANTEQSATLVNADGRLATSEDGFHFADRGVVLDHRNSAVWGAGDELFPTLVLHEGGQWLVYYIPNGTRQSRKLAVAWGRQLTDLDASAPVRSGLSAVLAWGAVSAARVGPETVALVLNNPEYPGLEVRLMSLKDPTRFSGVVERYVFDDVRQAAVLLDESVHTWFMYYRTDDGYGVRLAPAGAPDLSAPTAPSLLTATPQSEQVMRLTWSAASERETGIAAYNVFRNGVHLATVKGQEFIDEGLKAQTEYRYEVSAINFHGTEGPRSVSVVALTAADVTSPRIVSGSARAGHLATPPRSNLPPPRPMQLRARGHSEYHHARAGAQLPK